MRIYRRLLLAYNKLLAAAFGLDPWHAGLALDRLYPADIIAYLNKRGETARESAIEIGCGLGDILVRLNYKTKIGYDSDGAVLKAAKFKNMLSFQNKTQFVQLDFPGSFPNGKHDAIILVNWIHHLAPETLKSSVRVLYEKHLNPAGEIILDTVADPEYSHNHSMNEVVSGLNCRVLKIGDYPRGREIYSLLKSPQ